MEPAKTPIRGYAPPSPADRGRHESSTLHMRLPCPQTGEDMNAEGFFCYDAVMSTHDHDHEHGSELSDTQLRVRALETILTEKGYVDPAALDAIVEAYETR